MTTRVATDLHLPGRLERTSVTLRGGELTCLIGPNGSGKTSLLHALAGIGPATGEIRIDGVDPRTLGPEQRRRLLAYLPASRDIRWPLSARDLVALGQPGARDNRAIDTLLDSFDLAALAGRPVDAMSTGERSRVLIARALVARSKVLLLDEPVANLDPLWQLLMMERFAAIARNSSTAVLVAMHDLDLALRFADRLIVMRGGHLVADDDPATLLSGPVVADVFGVSRGSAGWQPVTPPADRRSSR